MDGAGGALDDGAEFGCRQDDGTVVRGDLKRNGRPVFLDDDPVRRTIRGGRARRRVCHMQYIDGRDIKA